MDQRTREEQLARPHVAYEREGFLEVHVKPSALQPAGKPGAVDAIAAHAARHGATRVLVVCEDPDTVHDRIEAYWLGDAIASKLHDVRTAVLVDRPVDALEDFTVQIARDRGADLRFFPEEAAAIRWLLREAQS